MNLDYLGVAGGVPMMRFLGRGLRQHRLLPIVSGLSIFLFGASTLTWAQAEWRVFRSPEFQFRFLHPPDWVFGPPRGANVRATIFPGANSTSANCNIRVRPEPGLRSRTQPEINREIQSHPMTAADWLSFYVDKWPDVQILQSTNIKIDNQPAYLVVKRHTHETVDRMRAFKAIEVLTSSPGYIWHFGCAGRGATMQEAEGNYQHWEPVFRRILGSLVFARG